MCDQAVQVLVVRSLKAEIATANIIDGLVVDHEGAVGVLESGVSRQDRVVWLHDGGSCLWSWVDAEFKLALLSVVDGETLHEQGSKTRSSSTTKGVENEETLKASTVVGNTADLVKDLVDQLLADSVVTTSIVVRGILLSSDHVLWVEERAVGTSADLIDDVWLEIAIDGTWNVFALSYTVAY